MTKCMRIKHFLDEIIFYPFIKQKHPGPRMENVHRQASFKDDANAKD